MSYIQFESSRVKAEERRGVREARGKVLEKAKGDYFRRKEEEIQRRLKGDDKWMLPSVESRLGGESKKKKHKKKSKRKRKKKSRRRSSSSSSESPGQSSRELNPYWRDGGTGLPEDKPKEKGRLNVGGVGDRGADWLRRALRRAQEQAEEEGRTLEDVAGERWGSLEKLQSMIEEAEERVKGNRSGGHGAVASPHGGRHSRQRVRGEGRKDFAGGGEEGRTAAGDSWALVHGSSRAKGVFRKPSEVSEEDAGEGSSRHHGKLAQEDEWRSRFGGSSGSRSKGSVGNWRKKGVGKKEVAQVVEVRSGRGREEKMLSSGESSESEGGRDVEVGREQLLTDQEMNELGAKLVKAEILGNEGLAKELKAKLERAREVRKKLVTSAREEPQGGSEVKEEEVVLLTRTTSSGFARPVGEGGGMMNWGGKKKRSGAKVETHVHGKRVRYFADDDKYSLKEIFEREKLNTVEDSNEMFSKLAGKVIGKPESVNDMDDVFEENARFTKSMEREGEMERGRAIAEHRQVTKALDGCQWCLDSKLMLKHLIVAIGTKAYLCLPGHQSLTEGHCLIVPMSHSTCGTSVDEDVWAEIQEFRKALTEMFLARDQDCIFFENAVNLKRFPHMVLECVPMEKETGDLAPIYFKKAIQECEMEWSNNKKVVDLVNKGVRRAIPKGLPYFSVDFGLQSGFAHVIEDERQWPMNFAQEIIGGMLDLDHHRWRKKRSENFEQQRKKVVLFSKGWKEYDWTQKLKEGRSD